MEDNELETKERGKRKRFGSVRYFKQRKREIEEEKERGAQKGVELKIFQTEVLLSTALERP